MLRMNKNIHFNATSVDETENIILSMNADTMGSNLNISKSIADVNVYLTNKEVADTDFAEFEKKVLEAIQE